MGTAQAGNVDVILTRDPTYPNGIRFEMNSNFGNGQELTFKNPKKGDWFEIDFNIVDPDKTGYLFPDDPAKAMYVKPVSNVDEPCPENWDDPQYWPVFEAQKVTKGNRTLQVKNTNPTVQLFKFTLWVTQTPKDNGPCIPYDPIGDNRNAGSGWSMASFTTPTTLIAGAIILIVLVVAYKMWAM
jgi:peptidoglycan hydrolase-like protein with peptidoglycan-binding domain